VGEIEEKVKRPWNVAPTPKDATGGRVLWGKLLERSFPPHPLQELLKKGCCGRRNASPTRNLFVLIIDGKIAKSIYFAIL
jgi:hypothetical protein